MPLAAGELEAVSLRLTVSASAQTAGRVSRPCHQIRKRVGLHLAHDLTAVRLDGDLADAEFATDLFVQQTDTTNAITSRSRGVSDS